MKGCVAPRVIIPYIRKFFGIAALCEGICGPDLHSQVLWDYRVRAHRFECKPCLGCALSRMFFFTPSLHYHLLYEMHFRGGVRGVFFLTFFFFFLSFVWVTDDESGLFLIEISQSVGLWICFV